MMQTAVACTDLTGAEAAGHARGRQIATELPGSPDALLVGWSSAGEFTHLSHGAGAACALSRPEADAARQIVSTFRGTEQQILHHAALVLTDALPGTPRR